MWDIVQISIWDIWEQLGHLRSEVTPVYYNLQVGRRKKSGSETFGNKYIWGTRHLLNVRSQSRVNFNLQMGLSAILKFGTFWEQLGYLRSDASSGPAEPVKGFEV